MLKHFSHLSPIILLLYSTRLLILGSHIADAIVLTSLACLYGFWLYLEGIKEPEANVELKERIIALEASLSATKEKVNSINLGTSLRRSN